ncbi:hypothetical protein F5883DRAFT_471112 [Diaporthe sp. PMI_573]|nr:hypothetical protein F5883DRAFT_471112 [Diaporthaceae sp. PMI_573]
MCGLAGRMAMEIGLHSRDVYQQFLETEKQQEEADIISTSLIVLDRQWSAATGLPPNFQLSDFDYANAASVRNMYLKAMMSFTVMSQRFNEPICRVATGGTYEDDDAFETTNFQIEQWRKRSLEKQNFSHPGTWHAGPPANMPLWTVILYLRANAVRCILLRPFLLHSSNNTESSKRSIEPGLDTISDTINVLSILDRSTDVYRKQHPFLQHFLASSCAFLFLVIAYAEQNRGNVSGDSRDAVGRNFRKALALASAYSDSSRASRKLYDRLVMIKEPLFNLGILSQKEVCPGNERKTGMPDANHQAPPVGSTAKHVRPPRNNDAGVQHFEAPTSGFDDQTMIHITGRAVSEGVEGGSGPSEASTYVNMSTGLYESFLDDWTASDMNFFFSDSGM